MSPPFRRMSPVLVQRFPCNFLTAESQSRLALVILRNPFMWFVVVVFLDKQIPVAVGFLQRFDLLSLAFGDIGVNQPVVDLNLFVFMRSPY